MKKNKVFNTKLKIKIVIKDIRTKNQEQRTKNKDPGARSKEPEIGIRDYR